MPRLRVVALPYQRVPQGVQRRAEVARDADVDRVVGVDLGGKAVDVDDLLVAVGIDAYGVELLQLVADRDDQIGVVESEVDVVATHEADRAHAVRVIVGQHALAVERGGDADAERLGEAGQRCGRHRLARRRARRAAPACVRVPQ